MQRLARHSRVAKRAQTTDTAVRRALDRHQERRSIRLCAQAATQQRFESSAEARAVLTRAGESIDVLAPELALDPSHVFLPSVGNGDTPNKKTPGTFRRKGPRRTIEGRALERARQTPIAQNRVHVPEVNGRITGGRKDVG